MIYLDYNGSTPVDPRVAEQVEVVSPSYANPSSTQHYLGRAAAELIEEARHRVATFVSSRPRDVIFTSGASEAATLGVVGAMLGTPERPNAVVGATEHKAVLAATELGARLTGGRVRIARVLPSGELDLDHVESLVDETVSVVAAMGANNETGVKHPLGAVAEIASRSGAAFFVDATQLAGKAPLDEAAGVADLLVMSSHKIYGPKGAGALLADRHMQGRLVPLFPGGGQERGLRGGTQNTSAIVGFGFAAELAASEYVADSARLESLSSTLLAGLEAALPGAVTVNGTSADRLSNTLNVRFVGADADAIMASMPDVAVSSGSACQSAVPTQSHVLLSMGLSSEEASESLRISLGRPTTAAEVDRASQRIVESVIRVRELSA
ncbi:cysteine desulfurase [Gordonia sp. zg691]|uniref:cysteine desulfurase family protein n=1 Tax=Gordonia jinghuaiqii TaxID=2758710 RepID=UPI0016622199|nr:cysteine desulfurase family protein [Gordonia jinghuaiqii]MBD0862454.1 cysteine desulfurase [Gordonia jinghuaiqii]